MGPGCSFFGRQAARETLRRTTGVDVNESGGKTKIQTEDGVIEVQNSNATLPEGFPKGFPIYEGAKIEQSAKTTGAQGVSYTVGWVVDADLKAVTEYYEKALPDNGFKVDNSFKSAKSTVFSIKDMGVVGVNVVDGKTKVIVTLGIKK